MNRDLNYKLRRDIESIFLGSRKTYGSPRIWRVLRGMGYDISENTVARHMRDMGLQAKMKRKFKVLTTDSNHSHAISPNLLKQNFQASSPGEIWLSDISYVKTGEGWLYLTTAMDLFSRRIIGWSFSESLHADVTVMPALRMAILNQPNARNVIFHSDRGVQYACEDFRTILRNLNFRQSMSARGNCYDNAPMESFFHTLKTEHVYHENFQTKSEAKLSLFEWIEGFYNRQRIHSSLGYKTPLAMEENYMLNRAA